MRNVRLTATLALAICALVGCGDTGNATDEDVVVLDDTADTRTATDAPAADTSADGSAADTAVPMCGEDESRCGASCVDTDADPRHCGGCDQACEAEMLCIDGACQPCGAEQIVCGGACVDSGADAGHCGGCDAACRPGELCVAGRCRTPARAVAVGARHACRLADGAIVCWGDNASAQLGTNARGPLSTTPVPVDATEANGARWVQLVATAETTCGLLDDGRVQCWGGNAHGELGVDATLDERPAAAAIQLDAAVAALYASADVRTLCAVVPESDADALYCWGENAGGMLVDGGSTTYDAPRRVELDDAIVHIDTVAIGGSHLCVGGRDEANQAHIVCRGDDSWRQATVPSIEGRLDGGLWQLAAGRDHTCAVLDATREVVCWGRSARCQLGSSAQSEHCATASMGRSVLVDGQALGDVDALVASGDATCARAGTGLWCWGQGSGGNLGQLGERQLPSATALTGVPEVATLSMGPASTCLLEVDGTLWCSGSNTHGQLGDGRVSRGGPRAVPLPDGTTPLAVVSTTTTVCTLVGTHQGNEVLCWGDGSRGQLGVDPATLTDRSPSTPTPVSTATATPPFLLAAGRDHVCAVASGEVSCWGANDAGQAAPGAPGPWSAPTLVETGLVQTPVQLTTGTAHTCALSGQGGWRCWGESVRGALGDVTSPGPHDMATAGLAPSPPLVLAGDAVTCTASSQGDGVVDTLDCIGQHAEDVAITLDAGLVTETLVALDTAGSHTCALVRDLDTSLDEVRCWGPAEQLRLGDELVADTLHRTVLTSSDPPVSARHLAVGARHSCAAGGAQVACWGDNDTRQLGLDLGVDRVDLLPGGAREVRSLAAGDAHTCAVVGSGSTSEVICWGTSTYGQLGPDVGRDRADFALADFEP